MKNLNNFYSRIACISFYAYAYELHVTWASSCKDNMVPPPTSGLRRFKLAFVCFNYAMPTVAVFWLSVLKSYSAAIIYKFSAMNFGTQSISVLFVVHYALHRVFFVILWLPMSEQY